MPLGEKIAHLLNRERQQVETLRFSRETRKALQNLGYVIYRPREFSSIASIKEAGFPIRSTWHTDRPDIESQGARMCEMAFKPSQPFLPDSAGRTLDQQVDMVDDYSRKLVESGVEGAKAIIGNMPDLLAIADEHDYFIDERLFEGNRTRTLTKDDRDNNLTIGYFDNDEGIYIGTAFNHVGFEDLPVAVIVIPTRSAFVRKQPHLKTAA